MVQLYDASQRYPPSSIVQFNGGLYQTPVEIIHHEIPTNVLSSPWIYLATDALGRPTPQSQLHPPLFQSSLFQEDDDDDHEWGVIDAPEIFPRHPFPSEPSSSSREPSLSAHEAALEHQPNILLSEAAGEIVFKTAGKGLWSFSKEDPALEKLKEGVHRRVIGRDDVEGGRLAWLLSAQARKEYYSLPGAVCPEVRWVFLEPNEPFPQDALPIGEEREGNGQTLFVCRGFHNGSVQLGKCAPHIGKRHSFSYGGRELQFLNNQFEVLCGDPHAARWLTVPKGSEYEFDEHVFGAVWDGADGGRPVEGGRERDGKWLGVGRGIIKGGVHPGKVNFKSPRILVGWGGAEHALDGYQLLVYA